MESLVPKIGGIGIKPRDSRCTEDLYGTPARGFRPKKGDLSL